MRWLLYGLLVGCAACVPEKPVVTPSVGIAPPGTELPEERQWDARCWNIDIQIGRDCNVEAYGQTGQGRQEGLLGQ